MSSSESQNTNKEVWCTRCQRWHLNEPANPDKTATEQAQKIADDIDTEILQELMKLK